uniref:Uncharacterized protein n=1 Tax=Arundo donax TaxID=35708 RepID=A0A0A9F6D6_ARUDO
MFSSKCLRKAAVLILSLTVQ